MMGYWNTSVQGASFAESDEHIWGDIPADHMDRAISSIKRIFQEDWDREPTATELLAGFLFSTGMQLDETEKEALNWLHSLMQELENLKVELPMGNYHQVYEIIETVRDKS